jgi:hypothetical protein
MTYASEVLGRRLGGKPRLLVHRTDKWLVAIGTLTVALALPAASPAASAPHVGPLAVKEVPSDGSSAQAVIEPDGLRTEYAVWLEGAREGPFCESGVPCAPLQLVGSGYVDASVTNETVRGELMGLQSDRFYTWRMTARNADGNAETSSIFETGLSAPVQDMNTYQRPDTEGGAQAEGGLLQQRERNQASAQAAREAGERETLARERAVMSLPASRCVVPRLRGDSLRTARRALSRAHCKLGRVEKPRKGRGHVRVVRQGAPPGAQLHDNAVISIVLGLHRAAAAH